MNRLNNMKLGWEPETKPKDKIQQNIPAENTLTLK